MPTYDSASAIVGGVVTGQHVFHIDGYSRIKETTTDGRRVDSTTFEVGDCSWFISCCSISARFSSTDCVSIFVFLAASVSEKVKARARFSLLDQSEKPVPDLTRCTGLKTYSVVGRGWGFVDFIKREFLEKSEHLVDDCFTVMCEISVSKNTLTEDRAATSLLSVVPPSDLHRHLGDLLVSKEGADVTFQVAGEMFTAHRCVLAARSPVFKAQLLSMMREGCIQIDDMAPQVFKTLLHFIYTDSLPEMTEQEYDLMVQHLLKAADRYDIQRLKLICEDKLCECINLDIVATKLVLAEQHNCHMLKDACIEFLQYHPALDVVIANGDDFEHLTKSCPALLKELLAIWFEDDPIRDELAMCL